MSFPTGAYDNTPKHPAGPKDKVLVADADSGNRGQLAALAQLATGGFLSGEQYEFCEILWADIVANQTVTLGSTVLEICIKADTTADTADNAWNNLNHPLIVEEATVAALVNPGDYIMLAAAEMMYVKDKQGDTLTLYRGRSDTTPTAHANGVSIFYYPQGTPGSVQVCLPNASTDSDLDSWVKDFIKQELSITHPHLGLRARVQETNYTTVFRPTTVDSVKTCSTSIAGATVSDEFRQQYSVMLRGDHGGVCLMARQVAQDDIDFPGQSGYGQVSFASDFNVIPVARWRLNSSFGLKEVGYTAGGVLAGPKVDNEFDLIRCIFNGVSNQLIADGDWLIVLGFTEDAYPTYLRGQSPDDVTENNVQTFWGPDPNTPKPWLDPSEPETLYTDVLRGTYRG